MKSDNKIVTYVMLTALMVITFASALVIVNTAYGALGWITLLAAHLGMLFYIMRS